MISECLDGYLFIKVEGLKMSSACPGSFLLLNGAGSKDGEMASISVPVMDVSSELCVEFWYYMLGPAVSTLDLLVQTVCVPVFFFCHIIIQ